MSVIGMHVLVVNFGPMGQQWQFCYSHGDIPDTWLKKWCECARAEQGHVLEITDDYGQRAAIKSSQIHGMLVRDLSTVAESEIALMVQGAQNQMAAQQRCQSPIVPAQGLFARN